MLLNGLADQPRLLGPRWRKAIERQGGRLPPHLRGVGGRRARGRGGSADVLGRFAGYVNVGGDPETFPLVAARLSDDHDHAGERCLLSFRQRRSWWRASRGFSRISASRFPLLTLIVFRVASIIERTWKPLLQGLAGLGTLVLIVSLVLRTDVRRKAWPGSFRSSGPVSNLCDLAEFSRPPAAAARGKRSFFGGSFADGGSGGA